MAKYRVDATLEVAVSQSGKSVVAARNAEHALARVLADEVTRLILEDRDFRRRIWEAAGGSDTVDGQMTFSIRNLAES